MGLRLVAKCPTSFIHVDVNQGGRLLCQSSLWVTFSSAVTQQSPELRGWRPAVIALRLAIIIIIIIICSLCTFAVKGTDMEAGAWRERVKGRSNSVFVRVCERRPGQPGGVAAREHVLFCFMLQTRLPLTVRAARSDCFKGCHTIRRFISCTKHMHAFGHTHFTNIHTHEQTHRTHMPTWHTHTHMHTPDRPPSWFCCGRSPYFIFCFCSIFMAWIAASLHQIRAALMQLPYSPFHLSVPTERLRSHLNRSELYDLDWSFFQVC